MKFLVPIAATAAVVVLAVVLGTRYLPNNSSVGGPTPIPIGGQGSPIDRAELAKHIGIDRRPHPTPN